MRAIEFLSIDNLADLIFVICAFTIGELRNKNKSKIKVLIDFMMFFKHRI
ncbi:hypothetical protein KL86DYS2_12384 [uncultured Dysgonomonas sp.]|uniref:Uncharacterized protein n=1 Tax=uncultured Dysgonomonas sp. TaxID=206096 RepID=A0A212JUJ7_9BACT|nr:hypothetical protein KL86DYS2_12384 [uncultured Dysgonomonas sp.]